MSLSVDIRKTLGDFQLEVQFQTAQEPLALLGASGCGKSLTLRCIAGILTPDEGTISLNGITLFDSASKINLPPQKRQVGYLFQQYALFPHMTVRQNIEAAMPKSERHTSTVGEILRRFRLEDVSEHRPAQLSGGQQQRCSLARIMASKPNAILLDEPLSALDSYMKHQMETELTDMLEQFPGTVLWVSHDRGEVFRNCKQVCVMENGRAQGTYTLRQLFHEPLTEAAARLSGCENFADLVSCGAGAVTLPAWGITLRCDKDVSPYTQRAGIRAHHVKLANPNDENVFSCTVLRVIQDVFTTLVLLQPDGAAPAAPPLRMELPREVWHAAANKQHVQVSIAPRDILLLR